MGALAQGRPATASWLPSPADSKRENSRLL
jgi:hypothetical protein